MENGSKKYAVIVSDETVQMFINHARFLARISEKAANELIAEFEKKAKSLENLPERHPYIVDPYLPERKYRKLPVGTWLLMLYQIRGGTVFIDTVVDCRQDYSWLL